MYKVRVGEAEFPYPLVVLVRFPCFKRDYHKLIGQPYVVKSDVSPEEFELFMSTVQGRLTPGGTQVSQEAFAKLSEEFGYGGVGTESDIDKELANDEVAGVIQGLSERLELHELQMGCLTKQLDDRKEREETMMTEIEKVRGDVQHLRELVTRISDIDGKVNDVNDEVTACLNEIEGRLASVVSSKSDGMEQGSTVEHMKELDRDDDDEE